MKQIHISHPVVVVDSLGNNAVTIVPVQAEAARVNPEGPREFANIDYQWVRSYTGEVHGNGEMKGYIVTTHDGWAIACTCPDFNYRHRVCKHMSYDVGCIAHKGDELK